MYPVVARNMRLEGTVKMEAVVSSAGVVKHVSVRVATRSWCRRRAMLSCLGNGKQVRMRQWKKS